MAPNQSLGEKTFAFLLFKSQSEQDLNGRSRCTSFLLNPLAPRNFAENRVSVKPFSALHSETHGRSCTSRSFSRCQVSNSKYLKHLICIIWNISLQILGMRRRQNFEIFFFSRISAFSPPHFLRFSYLFLFSFPELCFCGKSFLERFLELGAKTCPRS